MSEYAYSESEPNEFGQLGKAATSEDVLKTILNYKAQQAELRAEYLLKKPELDALSKAEDEARAAWKKAQEAWAAASNQLKLIRNAGEEFNEKIRRLEREAARLKSLEAEKNHFAEWEKEIELNTIGRPWRELALDHQIIGAKKLAFVKSGILGDTIGLGKTLTSLIWADMIGAKKVIVFAPKEILKNFQNEIKRWAHDRSLIDLVSKSKIYRDTVLEILGRDEVTKFIITINLEAWRKDSLLIQDLIDLQPDALIIDEAHNIKDERTSAFKGVKEIRYAANMCSQCKSNEIGQKAPGWGRTTSGKEWYCKKCDYHTPDEFEFQSVKGCLPMTGTIILNKPEEFWTLGYLVDKKMFPRKKDFLFDYCWSPAPNRWKFRHGSVEILTKKIGSKLVVRDRKSVGIIIPPQEIIEYNLNFSYETYPEQFHAYKMLEEHSAVLLENDNVMEMNAFIAVLTRFRQMMTWPEGIAFKDPITKEILYKCVVKESIKVDRAEQLIKEIVNAGERVVLFSQFKGPLQELQRRLNNAPYEDNDGGKDDSFMTSVILDGDTRENVRDQIRKDFDNKTFNPKTPNYDPDYDYQWDILLANYRVGGTGLNFTAATHVIILDREWNPGKEEQALGRVHRIGQTRDTTVHVIKANSDNLGFNVDNFMDVLMEDKSNLVTEFDVTAKERSKQLLEMLRKDLEGS